MEIIYFVMVLSGIGMIAFGLWAVHCYSGLLEKLGALSIPLGLIITLLGVLLFCVPDFFFPE
ncbi:MAG: hypothetical protein V2A69_09550 [Pseudomonadota bacterium]